MFTIGVCKIGGCEVEGYYPGARSSASVPQPSNGITGCSPGGNENISGWTYRSTIKNLCDDG